MRLDVIGEVFCGAALSVGFWFLLAPWVFPIMDRYAAWVEAKVFQEEE